MTDIFISYSVKDEKLARFIRAHLVKEGLTVFLASISIEPGQKWTPRIFTALRSSDWVFFLASKNALRSKNVQQELGAAMMANKRIVPLMWNVTPEEMPVWIQQYQGITLKGQSVESIRKQVSALGRHVKKKKGGAALVTAALFTALLLATASSGSER